MKRILNYDDMNEEQHDLYQKTWEKHLDTYCPADEEGCRPCDHGCPCDRCGYDFELNHKFNLETKSLGLFYEDKYLK